MSAQGHARAIDGRSRPAGGPSTGLALARRTVAKADGLTAVLLAVHRSRTWPARLLMPAGLALLLGACVAAGMASLYASTVVRLFYRHRVALPPRFHAAGDLAWGWSDPLDESPAGEWLAETRHHREATGLLFTTAEDAAACRSLLYGSEEAPRPAGPAAIRPSNASP